MLKSEPLGAAEGAPATPEPAAAHRAADRSETAARVAEYQVSLGAGEEAVRAAESLADPDAVAIVAGQQPGLLGGPLFTLAKALSAMAWARTVAREHGIPAVPVFWVASEDHDLAEVNRVDVLDARDRVRTLALDLLPGRLMLSAVDPGPRGPALVEEMRELLPKTEFLTGLTNTLEPAEGDSIGRWFARIFSRWLGGRGLVVVEPHLFRDAGAPLLELERRQPGSLRAACMEGPVKVADPPFFLVREGVRTRAAEAGALPADPHAVSWDVITRVVAQNLVLPVAGHVVGPSEERYCRQARPAHDLLGITPPPLLPRARLLLVEGKVRRALAAFETGPEAVLDRGEDALLDGEVRPEEFDSALTSLERALESALADLRGEAGRVDDVLLRKTMGAEKELFRAIDRLRDHGRKAMDRVTGRDRERRVKILAHLLPGGAAQERVLSPLPFLARHGPGLMDHLLEIVERWPSGARAVYLGG